MWYFAKTNKTQMHTFRNSVYFKNTFINLNEVVSKISNISQSEKGKPKVYLQANAGLAIIMLDWFNSMQTLIWTVESSQVFLISLSFVKFYQTSILDAFISALSAFPLRVPECMASQSAITRRIAIDFLFFVFESSVIKVSSFYLNMKQSFRLTNVCQEKDRKTNSFWAKWLFGSASDW